MEAKVSQSRFYIMEDRMSACVCVCGVTSNLVSLKPLCTVNKAEDVHKVMKTLLNIRCETKHFPIQLTRARFGCTKMGSG